MASRQSSEKPSRGIVDSQSLLKHLKAYLLHNIDSFRGGTFLTALSIEPLLNRGSEQLKAFDNFWHNSTASIGVVSTSHQNSNSQGNAILLLVLHERLKQCELHIPEDDSPVQFDIHTSLNPLIYARWDNQVPAETALSSMIRQALRPLELFIPSGRLHYPADQPSPKKEGIEDLLCALRGVVFYLQGGNVPVHNLNKKVCVIVGIEHGNDDSVSHFVDEFLRLLAVLFVGSQMGKMVFVGNGENNRAIKKLEEKVNEQGRVLVHIYGD